MCCTQLGLSVYAPNAEWDDCLGMIARADIDHDQLPLLGHQHASAVYAICMAGFLVAATQGPLTYFIILMEMIDGHEMILSIMAAAKIASVVSRIFSKPLYAMHADQHSKD